MATSRKALIQASLRDRIATVTSANGYDTDIQKVFMDEIPMGLDLDLYELPAALVISGKDTLTHQQGWLVGKWVIEVQLIHNGTVGDTIMNNAARDIAKAVYANSPTVRRADAWRVFEGQPTAVWIREIQPDLNMIDANRFICSTYEVEYHTHPTDL